MRVQLAAEQHEPEAQARIPVQSMVQLFPLQGTLPAQEAVPRQEMPFVPALLLTPAAHDV